jgi:hypothetical protein
MSSPATSTPAGGKAASAHPSPAPSRSATSTGTTHPIPTRQPTGPPRATTTPIPQYSSDEKSGDAVIDVAPVNNDSFEKIPPPEGPLQIFHSALGIPDPKPPKASFFKKKKDDSQKEPRKITSANEGVYKKVISCERTARYKYYFCSWVVTLAMFLQIVVGASVTAFGAGSASHILITAFGAANTALASLLAVLKSQGLPNRIRQDWNMWRELREYIEEQERRLDLILSGKIEGSKDKLDSQEVWKMVKTIEERYRAVRSQIETNRPDTYIPLSPLQPAPK